MRSPEDVINVMPYSAYPLYQAERPRSGAERHQADAQLGALAASVARHIFTIIKREDQCAT
jgi:hypothetical protein